jgi:Outer membrane protein beta-barrel domain
MMKKKLTLLIFLFPAFIMAQEIKNGSIIFDMHPKKNKQEDTTQQQQQYSSDDDEEQQKPKKEKKVRQSSGPMLYTAADYKREGLFKAWFHAGINGSQIDGDNYAGYNQIGLDAGVGAMLRFHKYLAFTMSLDYSMKGARQQLRQDPNVPTLSKYQVQWDYVEVPVMLHVIDKELVMFGLGLQPGVMIRYKEWDENGNDRTSNPPGGSPRIFDLQAVAALHFIIVKRVTLGVKFSYSTIKIRGSMAANRFNGEYNNVLTFDVGYILSTVKKK